MQKKSKKGQMQKNSKKVNNLPKRSQVKPAGGVVRHGGDETVGGGEGALEVKKKYEEIFHFLQHWETIYSHCLQIVF